MPATPIRRRLCAGAALTAFLATSPARAEVVVYEHDGFNGRTITVTESMPDLRVQDFNDKASSVVIKGGRWQLCVDINYRGTCKDLGPGEYPSLSAMGFNDKLSSLRKLVGDGRSPIELFEHIHFEGRNLGLAGATTDLTRADFNDKASSIVVRAGRWEVCTDADFRGSCFTLGPGEYPDLTQRGLNDMISSVRPAGQQSGPSQGRPIKAPR